MNFPQSLNIPNAITAIRILLVPALVCLLLRGEFGGAIWLFLAAGMSDALDGFIARRFNLGTRSGAILDPLADKLLVVSTVIVLARLGHLPWWLALTIVARDAVIVVGAVVICIRSGKVEMAPSVPSKLNTVVQLTLIALILGQAAEAVQVAEWLPTLFGITFLTTVVSGAQYVLVWARKAGALPARKEKTVF